MNVEMIVSLVVAQVGEEKAKEILGFLKDLSDKLDDNVIMITQIKGRGACLLISKKGDMSDSIFLKQPKIIDLDKTINSIEI